VLADLGPDEMYRLFTTGDHAEVEQACLAVQDKLPVSVKNHSKGDLYATGPRHWFTTHKHYLEEHYSLETGRYEIIPPDAKTVCYNTTAIQGHWKQHISPEMVKRAYDKLHMVKFVHGDLSDLKDDGPFGLLYLSNATEHNNREQTKPQFENLRACLRPNAYVITASRSGLSRSRHEKYDRYGRYVPEPPLVGVEKIKDQRGGTLNWTQQMYRVSKPEAVAA
jgi:hypothetical protein